jgi:hypothetical protein
MSSNDGIWIPQEIWDLDLNPMQRIFLARVQSLSHTSGIAWAGDEYLAKELRCTVPYVRKLRKGLEDLGYLVRTGYGYGRKLSVELKPKEVSIGTSSNRNKYLQEQVPTVSQEVPIVTKEVPTVSQEVPTGAHIEEYNKELNKEEVKREETEPERMRRLIEEKEARERGEYTETPKAVVTIPARGAARATVVSNKAKPFDAEEVRDYFVQLGDPDPDEAYNFWDHFESNGWLVSGKTPMRDWKASVRRWMRSEFRKPRKKSVGERVREIMERDELNKNR